MSKELKKELLKIVGRYLPSICVFVIAIWWALSQLNLFVCPWYIMIAFSLGISLLIEIIAIVVAYIIVERKEKTK